MPSESRNETLNDMPEWECPHCGETFRYCDYEAIKEGSEIECPKCEKIIHVISVDYTMNVTAATTKEQ
jgi:predicted RNA-binding Zn-ribbon protein involved in translation (DUF1610 family)